VSALEVLCHPGGKVNKRVVQGVLRNAPYEFRRLLDKTFVVYESQSKPRVKATLPEALYDDLYWARNQFLHGNAVNEKVLHYRKSEKFYPLNRIAPVLYSAALVSFLDEVKIPGGPMPYAALDANSIPQFFASREGFRQIQKGLIAAATVHP
jgi:hypothetical protein